MVFLERLLLQHPEQIERNREEFPISLLPSFYTVFEHLQGYKPGTGDKILLKRHIIETWNFRPREIYTIVGQFFERFGYEQRKYKDIPSELVIW